MATVQGEFATKAQAEQAVASLRAAGAAAEDIRAWSVVAGGLPGAAPGGVRGYVAGAALGEVLDSLFSAGPHLADPIGVRIVVDISPSCSDPAAILRALGAANVR